MTASAEGSFNLYTISLEELARNRSAKQITSTRSFKSDAQFSPKGKEVYYLDGGRIRIVNLGKRNVRVPSLNLGMKVNFAEEKMEIFKQGWRYMRDHFLRRQIPRRGLECCQSNLRTSCSRRAEFERSSSSDEHNGWRIERLAPRVRGNSGFRGTPIGRLGLRFDREEYEKNGRLKIIEVITLSPAAVSKDIKVGEYLLSVDKTKIDGKTNVNELLENKVGKRVELEISRSARGAGKRKIVLKPISTGAEKQLLYRGWVESNRAYVEKISGGNWATLIFRRWVREIWPSSILILMFGIKRSRALLSTFATTMAVSSIHT